MADNTDVLVNLQKAHRECITLMGYLADLQGTVDIISKKLLQTTQRTIEVLDKGL